ncbi:MAG: DUF4174 domain-containing protein [Sulfitobacter sp.]|jgi:uncharacterized protein DUF4174|uniref:DUF4174 domain-containing protein n=1 Tax=Sulfitobacter profundi TaxID=2679961 RepID=A0ABW1YZ00_9RHOB|nr:MULTISPECIES: DUF4174 domain-containing protein [Sulfitobacter]AYE86851.1 hypothetical protein B5M07_12440 [Sulfitobacter sp. D7]UWR36711.1 DUF4174 domain-containing protein [Sulfitobacter sp. W074]WOI16753.1 DUF4174 domain-containing protein [Sulfitobacter sp. LC.270.F.C4]
MKRLISLVFAGLIASTAIAQGADTPMEDPLFLPADMADLSAFQWKKRPVLVFANSENDPAYVAQMEYLRDREEELRLRDVIVLTDTDPAARSALRLRMRPRGFMLVLVDKEGQIELRKPFPWDVREITRSIDKMPLRQREIREAKERDVIR